MGTERQTEVKQGAKTYVIDDRIHEECISCLGKMYGIIKGRMKSVRKICEECKRHD